MFLNFKRSIIKQLTTRQIFFNHLIYYPTSTTLTYSWSFGSLAGILFLLQIITGLLMASFYVPSGDQAFLSIEHVIRDVSYGWLRRYRHSNGASFFFLIIYRHIRRGILYLSFTGKRLMTWLSGVAMFFIIIAIAFLGYVLPWGQISFWAATVITNFFTIIPVIGLDIAQWIWGNFAVTDIILTRFFTLHFFLPIVLGVIIVFHLISLHEAGSQTPIGVDDTKDRRTFYPYYYLKDLFIFFITRWWLRFIVCYYPNILGHTDNYINANPLVTPTHIVPEWYFLPFYAILRAVPQKIGGVLLILGSILRLAYVGIVVNKIIEKTGGFTYMKLFKCYSWLSWSFFIVVIYLGYIGSEVIEYPFTIFGQRAVMLYFFYLGVFIPLYILFINILLVEEEFGTDEDEFRFMVIGRLSIHKAYSGEWKKNVLNHTY